MGLFSSIFSGIIQGIAKGTSLSSAYASSKGKSSAGIALDRFQSIVDAHSDTEDIVEVFSLNEEGCGYMSLDGYPDCWTQAYEEEYERCVIEAEILAMMGIEVDPEELIDWEVIEENAHSYACDLANAWYSGDEWIPEEVLDWAFYDLSDHNG